MSKHIEQPEIGGFCETCGHFAARHDEGGCHFPRPNVGRCDCEGMTWQGNAWPRPWLPAPDGLTASTTTEEPTDD